MKSLKDYFLSPANKEPKEAPKEPLQSSQRANENSENSTAKQEEKDTVVNSSKEKRKKHQEKRDTKSKKPLVDNSCEPVNGKTGNEQKGSDVQGESEVISDGKGKSPRAASPISTPKSNAFQLLMTSQKKIVIPENDSEKKIKSLSLKDSKSSTQESETGRKAQPSESKKKSLSLSKTKSKNQAEATADDIKDADKDKPKELLNGPVEEPARPQRASRQAKEKAKKSFVLSDEEIAEEKISTPKSKKLSKKKEDSEIFNKKITEKATKSVQDKKAVEKFKKRKMVISSDDEQECSLSKEEKHSPQKNTKMKTEESQMEIDEPEPSKKLPDEQKIASSEPINVDSDDEFVLKKGKKRKISQKEKIAASPEKNTPNGTKKTIAGYFTTISKDEAIKRAAFALDSAKTQTIKADVHIEPAGDQRKRSMGPSGRLSSSRSPKGADSIEVLESIPLETRNEEVVVEKKSPMKTPLKLMKRRKSLWQMKVKLLSPAKTVSEASSIASDIDTTDSGKFLCFIWSINLNYIII